MQVLVLVPKRKAVKLLLRPFSASSFTVSTYKNDIKHLISSNTARCRQKPNDRHAILDLLTICNFVVQKNTTARQDQARTRYGGDCFSDDIIALVIKVIVATGQFSRLRLALDCLQSELPLNGEWDKGDRSGTPQCLES